MLTKKKARALVEDEKNWMLFGEKQTELTRVLILCFKGNWFARIQLLSEPNPVYHEPHWLDTWSGEMVTLDNVEPHWCCGRSLSLPQMAERIWEIDHD